MVRPCAVDTFYSGLSTQPVRIVLSSYHSTKYHHTHTIGNTCDEQLRIESIINKWVQMLGRVSITSPSLLLFWLFSNKNLFIKKKTKKKIVNESVIWGGFPGQFNIMSKRQQLFKTKRFFIFICKIKILYT